MSICLFFTFICRVTECALAAVNGNIGIWHPIRWILAFSLSRNKTILSPASQYQFSWLSNNIGGNNPGLSTSLIYSRETFGSHAYHWQYAVKSWENFRSGIWQELCFTAQWNFQKVSAWSFLLSTVQIKRNEISLDHHSMGFQRV